MSKTAGFWKSLKIQITGFWKSFQISTEHNSNKYDLKKNPSFFVNNRSRRHCKTHIILFPKTNLKRIKLIKTIFSKNLKMKIAGFWKSSPQLLKRYQCILNSALLCIGLSVILGGNLKTMT